MRALVICLALIGFGSFAWANNAPEQACFMEGPYNLQYVGPQANGSSEFWGSVGGYEVEGYLSPGFAELEYRGQIFDLSWSSYGSMARIFGTIHGQMINWVGTNGFFSGYQSCIQ